MFSMSDLSIAPSLTEKSQRFSPEDTSLDSAAPNLLDMLPRQN